MRLKRKLYLCTKFIVTILSNKNKTIMDILIGLIPMVGVTLFAVIACYVISRAIKNDVKNKSIHYEGNIAQG